MATPLVDMGFVDGRSRRDPPRSADARSEEEFEALLIDTVVSSQLHVGDLFSIPAELGQDQARLFHATWLKYFSFFAWKFPSCLLAVASRCPYQDVRREIIEDCVDEEVGDEDASGRCHVDVLYEEAEACGITRDEIAATPPTPTILAAINTLDNLSRSLSWEASFCAVAALEIGASKPAVEARRRMMTPEQLAKHEESMNGPGLPERLGIKSEDLMFNALHAYKDQFHGGGELDLLRKYAADRRTQDEMLWAAKASILVMLGMIEEIRRLSLQAVGVNGA
jgi:pyrroloquinoline quinone (PQQ) biosynthesis protein C